MRLYHFRKSHAIMDWALDAMKTHTCFFSSPLWNQTSKSSKNMWVNILKLVLYCPLCHQAQCILTCVDVQPFDWQFNHRCPFKFNLCDHNKTIVVLTLQKIHWHWKVFTATLFQKAASTWNCIYLVLGGGCARWAGTHTCEDNDDRRDVKQDTVELKGSAWPSPLHCDANHLPSTKLWRHHSIYETTKLVPICTFGFGKYFSLILRIVLHRNIYFVTCCWLGRW